MSPISRPSAAVAIAALGVATLAACGHSSKPTAAATSPSASASATTAPKPVGVATCPLTGLPPQPGQKVGRVALAVKIDNINAARPQAGLGHADLVIEETVEGGLTRLFAVFQCDSATSVGPIRSARTSDGDLLRLFNGAVFGFSGANPRAIAPVRATSHAVLIPYDSYPQYYHRDYSRPAPHNVFSSTATILGAGLARDHKLKAPRTVFTYGPLPRSVRSAKVISMTWPSASASWTWRGHNWARTQNGSSDVLTNGQRVTAANVVVMSIHIASTGLHDVLGNPSPDDVVTGRGPVWVFRDAHVIRGHWSRPNRGARMRLLDIHGHVIPLHPGHTWIELLPTPRTPSVS